MKDNKDFLRKIAFLNTLGLYNTSDNLITINVRLSIVSKNGL